MQDHDMGELHAICIVAACCGELWVKLPTTHLME